MSWIDHHQASELLASEAQAASREDRQAEALALYSRAAAAECEALTDLAPSKTRTSGITAVSAASLYYKASELERAESVAGHWVGVDYLPSFAKEQLRDLLQSIWAERARRQADADFAPGQVLIAVRGGEVVHGGAPLDLIVDKVKTVQSILHRTAEFMGNLPFRKRGGPSKDIQEICRPWLFQAAPGSYQFAVAIQEKRQLDMLRELPSSRDISECFLQILRVGVESPDVRLPEVVPDSDYRDTFLKLTRNLAPAGTACDSLEVRSPDWSQAIRLDSGTRKDLGQTIRKQDAARTSSTSHVEALKGVLRALHLDKDWLELIVENKLERVSRVGDHVDDLIGPMVNKPVIVHVSVEGGRRLFLDIEPAD